MPAVELQMRYPGKQKEDARRQNMRLLEKSAEIEAHISKLLENPASLSCKVYVAASPSTSLTFYVALDRVWVKDSAAVPD